MPGQFITSPIMEKFNRTLHEYEKRGKLKINQNTRRNKENNFVSLKKAWHCNNETQEKQYEAIRSSELFSEDRKATFIKFNYRHVELKGINYDNVYSKFLNKNSQKQSSSQRPFSRGTMNVVEMWGEKMMKEVIGSLPFPKDRLKVLKMYSNEKRLLRYQKEGKSCKRLATTAS